MHFLGFKHAKYALVADALKTAFVAKFHSHRSCVYTGLRWQARRAPYTKPPLSVL